MRCKSRKFDVAVKRSQRSISLGHILMTSKDGPHAVASAFRTFDGIELRCPEGEIYRGEV
jgi:hypothetical protein